MQVSKHSLKTRPYLGPTSLVPDLSLLMANAGRVRPGQLVLEPFVGTGSLAIAAAELGAVVLGSDIDIRVLRGKQGRNLFTCFAHYGIGVPELIRADNSMRYGGWCACAWQRFERAVCMEDGCRCYREQPMFHAVICDPPYGVRAGARKSGVEKREPITITADKRADIIPATSVYEAVDVSAHSVDALSTKHRNTATISSCACVCVRR